MSPLPWTAILSVREPFPGSIPSRQAPLGWGSLGPARQRIERDGIAEVILGGRRFTVRRELLDDIAEQLQAQRLALLRRRLLVLRSPQDEPVPVDNARLIFDAARQPARAQQDGVVAVRGSGPGLAHRVSQVHIATELARPAVARGAPAGRAFG